MSADRSLSEYVAAYFTVPSREGFSAYRTGWTAHALLSALSGWGAWCLAARLDRHGMALAGWALALSLLAVLLTWGIGAVIGVMSHYNPLLTLGALAACAYAFAKGGGLALWLGVAAYWIVASGLGLIQKIRR